MIWRTSATTSFGDFKPFLGFLSKEPFTHGEMRSCYLLWITEDQGMASGVRWVGQQAPPHMVAVTRPRLFVAKKFLSLNGQDELSLLREDLYLQYKAKEIAAAYNQRNPPKAVDFVDCGIFLLRKSCEEDATEEGGEDSASTATSRGTRGGEGQRQRKIRDELYLVEPFLEGEYTKYSNNRGWESGDRATPAAFSHFSYEYSKGQLVVVDVQGVGDLYTDPGIHTSETWWQNCELHHHLGRQR